MIYCALWYYDMLLPEFWQGCPEDQGIISFYYMASSASGQDEPNRALWLATRVGKMEPSCTLGTTRCIPQAKFPQKPYNESFIDQVCLVKMAGYWPRSFFFEFMDLDFISVHKHAKRELCQYPAILTSRLVNNPYFFTVWIHFLSALYFERLSSFYFVSFNIVLRHETILSLLRCIEALVQCFSKRKVTLDCGVVGLVNPILKQIWTSTLRVVGIKHLTDSGFSLLTTLLQVTSLLFRLYLDHSSWFESFLADK